MPSVSCKEKVEHFVGSYGKSWIAEVVGVATCVLLLVNVVIGLLIAKSKENPEVFESDALSYQDSF